MTNYESKKREIGQRIFQERQRAQFSKRDLLTQIFMSPESHKTVTAWESGERLPDIESLVRMADLFQCDIGYLLCDYGQRTRDLADVHEVTGLSEAAIRRIIFELKERRPINVEFDDKLGNSLNRILVSTAFWEIVRLIGGWHQSPPLSKGAAMAQQSNAMNGVSSKIREKDVLGYHLLKTFFDLLNELEDDNG